MLFHVCKYTKAFTAAADRLSLLKFDLFIFSETEEIKMYFDPIEFGRRLKKMRKERRLTQEELAEA